MSIFAQLGIRERRGSLHEEALYNLAACYGMASRRIDQTLKPFGLSAVTMNALLIIKHLGGEKGLQQSEIARRMIVSAGNITRLLDRLEKQGWVERRASAADRRIKCIVVTSSASKLLEKVWPVYLKCVDGIVSLLSKPHIKSAVFVLDDLRKKLSINPGEAL